MEPAVTGPAASLGALNAVFEETGSLSECVWMAWVWGSDPEEECDARVLMNKNHLLGLLVCRFRFLNPGNDLGRLVVAQPLPDAAVAVQRLSLMQKTPVRMTWRELRDTLANMLIEWPVFVERLKENPHPEDNMRGVLMLLNEMVVRFGEFCTYPQPPDVLDDPCDTQPFAHEHEQAGEQGGVVQLNAGCTRRTLGALMTMYRHVNLLRACTTLPAEHWAGCGLTKYHWEASMDDFHALVMHATLPVAARLNYKHDFPGMYNHVSQVVYFHNPEYRRVGRHAFDDLLGAPPLHVLPALWQLYPEVRVRYEEENFHLDGDGTWFWLVVAGRIYMVTGEGEVLHSEDVTALLRAYVEARPGPGAAVGQSHGP